MNVDLEQAAGAVAPVRCLYDDMTGGHAAVKALQGIDMLRDLASERLAGRSALETHSQWCAHGGSCPKQAGSYALWTAFQIIAKADQIAKPRPAVTTTSIAALSISKGSIT